MIDGGENGSLDDDDRSLLDERCGWKSSAGEMPNAELDNDVCERDIDDASRCIIGVETRRTGVAEESQYQASE